MSVDAARAVVASALRGGVFPAATVNVGDSRGTLWHEAFGTSLHTLFDLSSLTKVIATTTGVMRKVGDGSLRLETRIAEFFDEWRGADRESVTLRDLLEHASGLAARLVDAPPAGRREFEHDICAMKLEYEPRSRSIYSDLGFILLGFLVRLDVGIDDLVFNPPSEWRSRIAPTLPMSDDVRRGRVLVGDVHDNYAAALNGVAGHAGLFGTADAVASFGRMVLSAARGRGDQPFPFTQELAAVHHEEYRPRQLPRARLGHDAADLLLRHEDVASRVRARRVYRHILVDRSIPRSVLRAAHQSGERRRHHRRHAYRAPRVS
jgi:CubicO group peptidase (beta-lactamase class C family)